MMRDPEASTLPLVGGWEPRKRLAIHQRHYEASLIAAIREKFPATAWLVGESRLDDAVRGYVRSHPPERPCIAEYGKDFPTFLSEHRCGADLPYLGCFAELEWHVGQASIAVDQPAMSWSEVVRHGSETLLSAGVVLQPGVRYLQAGWVIDQLMTAYLTDSAPDTFVMERADVHMEIRGARGSVQFERVDPSTWLFRTSLLNQCTVAAAAENALERDSYFDAGRALAALVWAGLVTEVVPVIEGTS